MRIYTGFSNPISGFGNKSILTSLPLTLVVSNSKWLPTAPHQRWCALTSRMFVMSFTLLVTLAGCSVEFGGKCMEALCLLDKCDWSAVDSKDIFVVNEGRGRLVEETVANSTLSEAFRRTLTMTRLKHKLSACIKHLDNPLIGLYDGPMDPTISKQQQNMHATFRN